VALSAGQDLTVTSSRIEAANEAYLVAGGKLALLAAEDSDYSLYDKKKKGHFGAKKTKHDEVTDVTNVGTEIKTGGDLLLVSGGDQTYQAAKLDSGKDLTLNSGGAIAFEGVKDLHQENHTKSNSNLAWNSAKGKGKTDETLKQSELVAQGEVAIHAVDGLNIDVKQVNQQTVSQAIDAMVKADPQLAWLKDAEQRGDVDWRQVKEIHDSFKYSQSSLGQGAMLAIIIVVSALTAGAASGALGTMAGVEAGSGFTMAAAGSTAMVQAGTAVGTAAAGLGNIVATAAITSVASKAAVSVINNKGQLGSTLKDVTSAESMKGYLTSAAMAGMMPGYDPASLGLNLASVQAVLMKSASDAFVNSVINGGSYSANLSAALAGEAGNVGMAFGFKMVGDFALGKYDDGTPQKVMAHALVGGLLAQATGGDFKTGAMAAGASEALVNVIKNMVGSDKSLQVMASQLTGLVAAASVNGDVGKGAEIAKYGAVYNRQLHSEEQEWLEKNAKTFADKYGISEQAAKERLAQQALKDTDILWRSLLSDGNDVNAQAFLESSGQTFTNELGKQQALFTTSGNQLFLPEMFADTVDPVFYKKFVQSGMSRELSAGVIQELKDSGVDLKNGAVNLYDAARQNPGAVLNGLWESVGNLPENVVDGFVQSGKSIGEGVAVAADADLSAKLNAIYGQDVGAIQKALLAIRIFTAVAGAKGVANVNDVVAGAISKKLDAVLVVKKVEKNDIESWDKLTYLSNSSAPEIRERLTKAIDEIRRELPEKGNAAFAEINIDSFSPETVVMKAFSGYNERISEFLPKPDGDLNSWLLKPKVATSKYVDTPEGYLRDMDTEFKVLENLAQKLKGNSAATGSINLISEKAVCPSCTSVIQQFRDMYPRIKLNVFTVEE
ncbi:hypothetical protein HBH25_22610, partial [Pseudomonas sp. hsmgli-8]